VIGKLSESAARVRFPKIKQKTCWTA